MKTQIFVSDGYPEAGDYDTNYVDYDPQDPASVEGAKAEARRIIEVTHTGPVSRGLTGLRLQPAGGAPGSGDWTDREDARDGFLDRLIRFLLPQSGPG